MPTVLPEMINKHLMRLLRSKKNKLNYSKFLKIKINLLL